MKFFLKSGKTTVVDVTLWFSEPNQDRDGIVDINSVVNLEAYSRILIGVNGTIEPKLISDFDHIVKLKSWLWNEYKDNNDDNWDDIKTIVSSFLYNVANKYGLQYVED